LVDYVDGDGNGFAIIQSDDIYDFRVERLAEPGRTLMVTRRNPYQALSETIDGSTESESLTIHSPRIRTIRKELISSLRRQHSSLSRQEESEIDTDNWDGTFRPEAGFGIGTDPKSRPYLSGRVRRGSSRYLPSQATETTTRQEHPPTGVQVKRISSQPPTGPPLQFENATQASLAMNYPYLEDSSSESFDSATSGVGDSSPTVFDSPEGHACDSGFEGSTLDNLDSTERYNLRTLSTPSTSSYADLSRDAASDANTLEGILDDNEFLQSAANLDFQDWILFSDTLTNLEQDDDRNSNHKSPRQLQTSTEQEAGYESDPYGIYNASPPRRRQVTSEQEVNEPSRGEQPQPIYGLEETGLEEDGSDPYGLYNASPSPQRQVTQEKQADENLGQEQPQAAGESVESRLVDPDETEEDISSQPRSSDQERLLSSSDDKSTSRGRSRKKSKRNSRKSKKEPKKISRSRR
jgi:hypothetical protein